MSDEWTDLAPQTRAATAKEPVRFGLSRIGRNAKRSRGVILIRRDVVEKLNLSHWRVAVRLGKGPRAHQVAIVPDKDGAFELREVGVVKGGGTFKIVLPEVQTFPDAVAPAIGRSFKIEQAGKVTMLVIDLPAYCWDANARKAFEASR